MIGYETSLFPPVGMPLPIRNSRIKLSQGHVFWREVGHGTPIVFLNGSWSEGSEWVPVLERLGRDYHCLALDLIGFGESDRPKLPYSIGLEADALLEFIDALRLKRVFLVAPEVGGWVAAHVALNHPERVIGLVLLGAEGVALPEQSNRWFWPRLLTAPIPLLPWLLRSLSPLARFLGKAEETTTLLKLRQQLRRSPVACRLLFKRRQAAINAELLNDKIPQLKMPLLVLQAETDTPIRSGLNRAYATAPQAKLRLVSDPYPTVLTHSSDELSSEIATFISSHLR